MIIGNSLRTVITAVWWRFGGDLVIAPGARRSRRVHGQGRRPIGEPKVFQKRPSRSAYSATCAALYAGVHARALSAFPGGRAVRKLDDKDWITSREKGGVFRGRGVSQGATDSAAHPRTLRGIHDPSRPPGTPCSAARPDAARRHHPPGQPPPERRPPPLPDRRDHHPDQPRQTRLGDHPHTLGWLGPDADPGDGLDSRRGCDRPRRELADADRGPPPSTPWSARSPPR